jgi:phosphoglycolate phosphatase
MTVLSNKPVNPCRAIIDALGLKDFFAQVYGGNSFATKKPDPAGAQAILREIGAKAEETLFVGDSSIDVVTGRNASMWTCGVTYGFAPLTLKTVPPDVVVDSPELAQLFKGHEHASE